MCAIGTLPVASMSADAEALGAAYPLLGILVLAMSGLALTNVHWSMVMHWNSGFLSRITPDGWPNQAVWGVVWILVVPCVLLPIFGHDTFLTADFDAFAVAKLYTLVFSIGLALAYKLSYMDASKLLDPGTMESTRRRMGLNRGVEVALSFLLLVNVMEATLWQIIVVGQRWWDVVNACSGLLLCAVVVVSALRWGVGVRVYAYNSGLWDATEQGGVKTEVTPLKVKSYGEERQIHIWLTPLFVLAYTVWNAAFLAVYAPEDFVFFVVVSLLTPLAVVAVWPRASWIDARAHTLLGAALLVKFPGVQVAALLRSTAPWAGSEAMCAALSTVGMVLTLACCADMMRAGAKPLHYHAF